ncbi:MAG: ATP-binding protein [Burkholderiales bacterium]
MDASADWFARHMATPLAEAMTDTPVVCLLGPRQCGKSTLARRAFPGRPYFSLDDDTLRERAALDPRGFVAALPDNATLDEIQRAPALLPSIKMAVDEARQPGRFLLTGSANLLLLPSVSESLAGRMALIRLHPLTEAEKERKPGGLLAAMIGGRLKGNIRSKRLSTDELIDRVLRGGYPEAIRRARLARVRQWHRDYLAAIIERDARDAANLRSFDQLENILSYLALQTAQLLNIESLAKHLAIRRETVQNNLAALERLFLIRRLPGWHSSDARRLVKAPKIHIVDSGIASTLAGLVETDWLTNMNRFGHLLESFVIQQLIAQAEWTDPDLRFWHYRDKDQVEVDLVITRGRETWGVEVKAAATLTPSDGQGMRRLAEQCGRYFKGGMILHAGTSILPTSDSRVLAVPLSELWTT